MAERGRPKMIVSDNGSKFTSNAILSWADAAQVEWHYIAPGKPMQNAFIESFNGKHPAKAAGPWLCRQAASVLPARRSCVSVVFRPRC